MKITCAVVSDVGQVRSTNQDNYFLAGETKPVDDPKGRAFFQGEDSCLTFSVCDGLGGGEKGEVAASIAVEKLKLFSEDLMWDHWESYIKNANLAVCDFSKEYGGYSGTTFAGTVVKDNLIRCINVGDSRIYRIRNHEIKQLSLDHTEFQYLLDSGQAQAEDFAKSNAKNHLTQHLGILPDEMSLEPYFIEDKLKEQDLYLLCSDGLYGVVPDEMLLKLSTGEGSLLERCDYLVEMALTRGSRDNITALLFSVDDLGDQVADRSPYEDTLNNSSIGAHLHVKTVKDKESLMEAPQAPVEAISNRKEVEDSQREISLKEEKEGKKLFKPVLLLVVILGLLLAGGIIWFQSYVKVPDVSSMELSQAREILENIGMTVDADYVYDSEVPQNVVMDISYTGDSWVKKGSRILLTVSKGAEPVSLPDFCGQKAGQAIETIEALNLRVDKKQCYSDTVAAGYVISQVPEAGNDVLPGSIIKITVSKGKKIVKVKKKETKDGIKL